MALIEAGSIIILVVVALAIFAGGYLVGHLVATKKALKGQVART